MKTFKLNSLTSIVITMAIMLSCGGYLIADDAEQPEVVEEPVIEQVEEESEVIEDPVIEQVEEEPEVVEDSVEEEPSEEDPIVEEPLVEEPVEEGELTEDDTLVETIYTVEDYACDDSGYDSDYLSEQYIMQEMSVGSQVSFSHYNNQSNLNPTSLIAYNYVYPRISAIADGQLADTSIVIPTETLSITYTAEDLGIDPNPDQWSEAEVEAKVAENLPISTASMLHAFLSGCPYELYWFDKSNGGLGFGYNTSTASYTSGKFHSVTVYNFEFSFTVANEFRDKDASPNNYTIDTSFGSSARAAAANAREIIDTYAGLSDYAKLSKYNEIICQLVDYDYEAAGGEVDYGNPWQLVYVFDENPKTKVVCEGYSKAFQFLCDNSHFNNPELYVISVSGTAVFSPTDSGPHMWNIVHMDDGFNYLIDVTNNDTNNNELFMLGSNDGSVSSGYYLTITDSYGSTRIFYYTYNASTLNTYTSSALTLAANNYDSSASRTPEFRGHAMALSGQIGLQFVVELPDSDIDNSGQYYISFTDDHNHINCTDQLKPYSTLSHCFYAQVNISSIEMADNITPTLHRVDGDQDIVVLIGSPYSARDYINWGLANLSTSSREYKIISALADYGHYSQPYLSSVNNWTNDGSQYTLMSTYCTDTYDYTAISGDTFDDRIVFDLSGTGFTGLSYSLRFGNTVTLRVYLAADDYDSIDVSRLTFTGGVTPVVGRDANNRITITFNDILATALTNRYTISYNSTEIVSVSPMSYVYGMLNTTGTSDAGRDLVCALYNFAEACS